MPADPAYLTSRVEYLGQLRTRATHVASGAEIVTDAPTDNHGRGEAFSPTDLAATALASCMLTIVGIAAQARDFDIDGATAEVVKVMGGPPRRIRAVRTVLHMPARAYTPQQQKVILEAARGCPVARSLGDDVDQELEVVWATAEATTA